MKTRSIKIFALIIIVFSFIANGQTTGDSIKRHPSQPDLFDAEHTRQFADYLYKSGQYDFAVEEYQRLVFLDPGSYTAKTGIIKSFRQMKQNDKALFFYEKFFPSPDTIPVSLQKIGVVLNTLEGYYPQAVKLLKISKIRDDEKETLMLGILILQKKWKESLKFYNASDQNQNAVFHQFGNAVNRRLQHPNKSPFLAGAMSAVVPGLGKVYTKNYGDALMSFVIVGLNAWQAWRGFSKNGIKSAHGWIFAGIGASFYLGNIWGSAKSAKKYNEKLDNEAINEVKAVLEYNY